ncbi:hypothetical protein [Winogradskyella sp. A3E31]|uniref:hypothetical protein n=1 Tax=Winogradskyella sp. A3E31 TaxID=3349637 RepID=UPI00398BA62C
MNKKTIDIIYKWTLRVSYARAIILGIVFISFALVLLITDYKITTNAGFNVFLIIFLSLLGIVFIIVGLFQKAETEYGIRNKWHEKEIE